MEFIASKFSIYCAARIHFLLVVISDCPLSVILLRILSKFRSANSMKNFIDLFFIVIKRINLKIIYLTNNILSIYIEKKLKRLNSKIIYNY